MKTEILLLNKPFNVLCQFTDPDNRANLSHYISEPGYYAAGRLDRDSEGLVVLTNNGKLQNLISSPKHKLGKTYCVQVDGSISNEAIQQLEEGVTLKDGLTAPAGVIPIEQPKWMWHRDPPVRARKSIPTSWIQITLYEGRNRQVRRMTAATGFPTLRLIRIHVGKWSIKKLTPGESTFATVDIPAS